MHLTARERENITFSELMDRLREDRSLANHPNREITLKTHSDGSCTISPKTLFGGGHRSEAADLMRDAMAREMTQGTSKEIFERLNLATAQKLKVSDLQQLGNAKDLETARSRALLPLQVEERQQHWQAARATANQPGQGQRPAQSPDLTTLFQHESTKPTLSASGTNCPLVVASALEPSGGTLLKPESGLSVEAADTQSTMIAHLAELTKDGEGHPLGFEVAKAVKYVPTQAEKTALLATVDQMAGAEDLSPEKRQRFEKFLATAAELKTKEELAENPESEAIGNQTLMTKMDFVKGTQLNHLPLADKVALLKSPDFAQQMGRLTALGPMMGLADHVALTEAKGYTNDAGTGLNNVSNFMMHAETGAVVPIDYASRMRAIVGNTMVIGLLHPDTTVMNLAKFVHGQNHDTAAQQMVADITSNRQSTPVAGIMEAFLKPEKKASASSDAFLNHRECYVLENETILSTADKIAFAKNFMEGARNGLEFIEKNIPHFETAYAAAAAKSGLNPLDNRHFMKADQLHNLAVGLPAMKVNVDEAFKTFRSVKDQQMERDARLAQGAAQPAVAAPANDDMHWMEVMSVGSQLAEHPHHDAKHARKGSVLDTLNKQPKQHVPKVIDPAHQQDAAEVGHGAHEAPAPAALPAVVAPAPAPAAGQPKAAPGTLRAATEWQRVTKPSGNSTTGHGHGSKPH